MSDFITNADLRIEAERLCDENDELRAGLKCAQEENIKLRELVLDMWPYTCGRHDCQDCEHYELYKGQRFVGECEYHRRMRELGIEASNE